MGGVRPIYIKRAAREFIARYPGRFSTDYRHNATTLAEIMKLDSKRLHNRVAGYITTLVKQQSR